MPDISLASELAFRGLQAGDLARMVRREELVRVRRGAYGPVDAAAGAREAHLRLLEATVRQSSPDAVVSHASAAALYDLPIWSNHLSRVHLTRDRVGGGRRKRYSTVHGHPLEPVDVTEVGGFQVTSLARTIVDLACCLPPEQSVAAGDAALRRQLDRSALTEQLARARRRTGVSAARWTIGFLDPRSETAGESVSRVVMWRRRIPAPTLQYEVRTLAGILVGRSDFVWPELNTLGEFDGRIKYTRAIEPVRAVEDVVYAEKLREDALRDLGWQVVRWGWTDLSEPDAWLARLQRAFDRGRR